MKQTKHDTIIVSFQEGSHVWDKTMSRGGKVVYSDKYWTIHETETETVVSHTENLCRAIQKRTQDIAVGGGRPEHSYLVQGEDARFDGSEVPHFMLDESSQHSPFNTAMLKALAKDAQQRIKERDERFFRACDEEWKRYLEHCDNQDKLIDTLMKGREEEMKQQFREFLKGAGAIIKSEAAPSQDEKKKQN